MPRCDVCEGLQVGSQKLTSIIDINERWCFGCVTYGYVVGDQNLCIPAEFCDECEDFYSHDGIVKRDEYTGIQSCIDCEEGKGNVIQT